MKKTVTSVFIVAMLHGVVACTTTQTDQATQIATPPAPVVADIVPAQQQHSATTNNKLSLEQIMADPDWIGRQPQSAYWADDNQSIFYKRKQQGTPLRDIWQRSLTGQGNGEKVALGELHLADNASRVTNRNSTVSVWSFEGNLFSKNLQTGQVRQLTRDGKGVSGLQFLTDGQISYRQGNGIYSLDLSSGFSQLMVSWKFAEAPKANKAPGDYIAEEQQKLIEYIKVQRSNREARFRQDQMLDSANSTLAPKPFFFDTKHQLVRASLSPNGKWAVLVTREKISSRSDNDIMPNYIKENGRIYAESVRQRVADAKPINHQLWLLDLNKHTSSKLDYAVLPGYNEDVLAAVKQENAQAKGEEYEINRLPRAIHLMSDWYWSQSPIQWHHQGEQVAIMLEAWDNKDRWIATVDKEKGSLIPQHRLHDDAWVNYKHNSFGWLNHSETLYFLSEQSGYANLYTLVPGETEQALVSGNFEVDQLTLLRDDSHFLFKANSKHPGIYEIYQVQLDSGEVTALTDLNGMTDYRLSPDETKLLLTHSTLTRPPELFVQPRQQNADPVQLTDTVSAEFKAINWTAPSIIAVPSSHTEQPIYSRVYQPKGQNAGGGRRAVIFNHGAGYLQNSHMGWSGYFREFMFHNMLVEQGYVVMDMDYRASAGYGRDWRTAIYRQMGTPETQDLRDGVNWLVENAGVDRNRVGTYGGSYGGFMTFMALFTAPDLFQAGAALRPVTDWAHYNHGYTSNILNMPDIDPIAYQRSSPLYFAEGLQKPLLINAPMVDNNVFFVDVVRLVQRLIELEKQDFETAIYPVEPHGFVQPSSWLDEYRRIYKLFETHL